MNTFRKQTIVNKLAKAGLELNAYGAVTKDRYRLMIKPNGNAQDPETFWYIAIYDLHDPGDSMTDYFTTYFPETIKAAIRYMGVGI